MNEVLDDIKSKEQKNVYLFCGKEKYLIDFYLQKVIDSLLDKTNKDMNYDIFDEKNLDAERLIESMDTLPIFAEKRVVYLKEAGIFEKKNKKLADKLLEYIKNIPYEVCLIIEESEIPKDSELIKHIKNTKTARLVSCDIQNEVTLVKWIQKKLRESGKEIDSKTAVYMLRKIGLDMSNILNEVSKLSDYKSSSTNISISDIDEICIESVESKIFDLLNEIGRKNVTKAMNIYTNLLYMGEPIQRLIYMISRQFMLISDTKMLAGKNFSVDEIAKLTGSPKFTIIEYIKQIENFSNSDLKEILEKCLEIDISSKTGNIDPKVGLEMLILGASRK